MAPFTALLRLDQLWVRLSAPTAPALQQIVDFGHAAFFLADEPIAAATATPAIPLDFHLPGAVQPPARGGAPVYQAGDLGVWRWRAGFLLTCGDSWLALDLVNPRGWGVSTRGFWHCRPQDQRDFWLLIWLMLGHRHGYYGLHANGLRDRQGDARHDYLLIGPSGSGKSTLALRLIEQGWQHSGDDVVLLYTEPSSSAVIHARALRRDFALAPQTLAACTSLRTGVTTAAAKVGTKVFMAIGVEPAQWCCQLQPTRLCFATLIDQGQSRLTPLEPAQALIWLAQQSAGVMTDRQIAQRQLALLAKLCQQAQLYQLALGTDVLTAPSRVATLLRAG